MRWGPQHHEESPQTAECKSTDRRVTNSLLLTGADLYLAVLFDRTSFREALLFFFLCTGPINNRKGPFIPPIPGLFLLLS